MLFLYVLAQLFKHGVYTALSFILECGFIFTICLFKFDEHCNWLSCVYTSEELDLLFRCLSLFDTSCVWIVDVILH